jgi:alkylation response protein AidB-like acyl-CoA dehydrogenase
MLRPETEHEQEFRQAVRTWLEASLPASLRDLTFRPEPEAAMQWYRTLSQRGWIAPHWSKEEGGMGATPVEQLILMEEFARIGAPELPTQGLNQIGPTLLRFGSAEQRERHIPPILNGTTIWCQGYSEPQAGSDLTALRTRGVIEGDTIRITGHKIWTTWGHHADWMYALVRTDPSGKRGQGISLVLIDLRGPGITRRPIITIAGDDEFAEVHFDDAPVPAENLLGDAGQGWKIATALLDQERLLLGTPSNSLRALERVRRLMRALGQNATESQHLLALEAEMAVDTLSAAWLAAAEGRGDAMDVSSLKVLASETAQTVLAILGRLGGTASAFVRPRRVAGELVDFTELRLQSYRLSIYGGSNEIQRQLIAGKTLALPSARRN